METRPAILAASPASGAPARIATSALERSVRDSLIQTAAGKAGELEAYAGERVRDAAALAWPIEHEARLRAVLGDAYGPLRRAVEAFDFEAALAYLRQAGAPTDPDTPGGAA